MKKVVFVLFTALLGACSSQPQISGVFQGTLPCADCQKIEASLVLGKDNTYQLKQRYFLQNNETRVFTEKGEFHWDTNKKQVIRLTRSGNLALFVGDNYVEICDPMGNRSSNNHQYKLNKIY